MERENGKTESFMGVTDCGVVESPEFGAEVAWVQLAPSLTALFPSTGASPRNIIYVLGQVYCTVFAAAL